MRSGAFGLVVLDLSAGIPRGELGWQSKLHGLLRMHEARLVVLSSSEAGAPSLGPSVSLRIEPVCRRVSADRWVIEHRVLKSKLGGDVRISPDVRAAPEGATPIFVGPGVQPAPLPEVPEGAQFDLSQLELSPLELSQEPAGGQLSSVAASGERCA